MACVDALSLFPSLLVPWPGVPGTVGNQIWPVWMPCHSFLHCSYRGLGFQVLWGTKYGLCGCLVTLSFIARTVAWGSRYCGEPNMACVDALSLFPSLLVPWPGVPGTVGNQIWPVWMPCHSFLHCSYRGLGF